MLYDLLGNSLSDRTLELLERSASYLEGDTPMAPLVQLWTKGGGWCTMSTTQLCTWAICNHKGGHIASIDDAIAAVSMDPETKILLTGQVWHMRPILESIPIESIFRVRVRRVSEHDGFRPITMIPRVPETTMRAEDRQTPRVPMAESVAGALASMMISEHLFDHTNSFAQLAIEVFVNANPIEVIWPSVFEVPDAWATQECWAVDPVELVPWFRIEDPDTLNEIARIDKQGHYGSQEKDVVGSDGVANAIRKELERYLDASE